jgi:3-isopropylmalate/(R)-2-methylmalate dehydratase small subunit
MQALSEIRARTVVIPTRDIDTDQIIAARFLTTTTKEGLGRSLFHDLRYDSEGRPRPEFPLNRPDSAGCRILVSGNNFGCGSSREHAPWALLDYGFQAIVSTEIADIFFNNALKNGLVPVVVDEATHRYLLEHPGVELTVDVRQSRLVLPDGRAVTFPMDRFARHCLVEGIDQLGYLLQHADAIGQFEHGRRWTP